MKSTFLGNDCIYLLKDLTGIMSFTPFSEKEKNISNGINYSEMITAEEPVSSEINHIFRDLLESKAEELAKYIDTSNSRKLIIKFGYDENSGECYLIAKSTIVIRVTYNQT
jgi:hypothetical protein